MIVQYCSDLHLEFRENRNYLQKNPLNVSGEVLILAGDIMLFRELDQYDYFFDYLSDHFEIIYWIPGNHEYYYSDIKDRTGFLNERLRNNLFLVNNCSVEHNGTQFVFSTLWSRVHPANEWHIQNSISDFQVIKANGNFFSVSDFNRLHEEALNFILSTLEKRNQKTIVVSHHVPTFFNYPKQYKGSVLNEAFATELFPFIEKSGPDYWIFGHHHSNIPEFNIGQTKMLTNQLGYVHSNEHHGFQRDAFFVI